MPLEVGFSNIKGLEASLERSNAYDFDYLEFLMDNKNSYRKVRQSIDTINYISEKYNIGIIVHLPFHGDGKWSIGTPDDEIRTEAVNRFKKCIDISSRLDAKKGVLHVETTKNTEHLAYVDQDQLFKTISSLNTYAQDRNFELCIENLPDNLDRARYPDLGEFESLLYNTNISLTIDTGHARVNGYDAGDVARFVSEHSDRISHFHLNDTRNSMDEHLPFRAGHIDFEEILNPVCKGWDGTLTLEVRTGNFDYIQFSKQKLNDIICE